MAPTSRLFHAGPCCKSPTGTDVICAAIADRCDWPAWFSAQMSFAGCVRDAVVASRGVWCSLVAGFVRDEEVVGSNPATPTVFWLAAGPTSLLCRLLQRTRYVFL